VTKAVDREEVAMLMLADLVGDPRPTGMSPGPA
jgi:hypothetical protein